MVGSQFDLFTFGVVPSPALLSSERIDFAIAARHNLMLSFQSFAVRNRPSAWRVGSVIHPCRYRGGRRGIPYPVFGLCLAGAVWSQVSRISSIQGQVTLIVNLRCS